MFVSMRDSERIKFRMFFVLEIVIVRVFDKVDRQNNLSVACDLRINGIPQIIDENLHQVFDSICKAINISMQIHLMVQ